MREKQRVLNRTSPTKLTPLVVQSALIALRLISALCADAKATAARSLSRRRPVSAVDALAAAVASARTIAPSLRRYASAADAAPLLPGVMAAAGTLHRASGSTFSGDTQRCASSSSSPLWFLVLECRLCQLANATPFAADSRGLGTPTSTARAAAMAEAASAMVLFADAR